jgi:hypothetical protein
MNPGHFRVPRFEPRHLFCSNPHYAFVRTYANQRTLVQNPLRRPACRQAGRGIIRPTMLGLMSSSLKSSVTLLLSSGFVKASPFEPFHPLPVYRQASVRILIMLLSVLMLIKERWFKTPCGERGIRTLDTVSRGIHTFQACALDHSATSPVISKHARFFSATKITKKFLIATYQIVISPRNDRFKLAIISCFEVNLPNKNISFVTAASLVISYPLTTPSPSSAILVSYMPISTLPCAH